MILSSDFLTQDTGNLLQYIAWLDDDSLPRGAQFPGLSLYFFFQDSRTFSLPHITGRANLITPADILDVDAGAHDDGDRRLDFWHQFQTADIFIVQIIYQAQVNHGQLAALFAGLALGVFQQGIPNPISQNRRKSPMSCQFLVHVPDALVVVHDENARFCI